MPARSRTPSYRDLLHKRLAMPYTGPQVAEALLLALVTGVAHALAFVFTIIVAAPRAQRVEQKIP